jgi:hypothetical protein
MTIWLLALVLLASLAALGYRQGAIRLAFSFLGVLIGAVLAVPLGQVARRLLAPLGVTDPVLTWALGPVIVFILIWILLAVAAAAVHRKVEVYYKYHVGDLRLALWERLSRRLGLCLGLLNGAAYLVLIAFVIYVPSYLTVQVASEGDPKWMRLLTALGRDLHSTGFDRVGRALDSIPQAEYDMADFGALLYRNPLLEARLNSYPAFFALADQPEIQGLADKDFTAMWQRAEPVMTLLEHPRIQAIRNNPALLKKIWSTVESNLSDLRTYLVSGQSPRYDPVKILGRWDFDLNALLLAIRRAKPNIAAAELTKQRAELLAKYGKARLIARPDNEVTLQDAPGLEGTHTGQWKGNGQYELSFPPGTVLSATVEGDRLTIKSEGRLDLVFYRED